MIRLRPLILVLAIALLLLLTLGVAQAKNYSTENFSRGECTTTDVHGSHGEESAHHGQCHSEGSTTQEPTECKVTGPEHTC